VDALLHRALAGGAVLTGGSTGGLRWFEGGTTDSFGPTLRLLNDGLGMIKGSYCPGGRALQVYVRDGRVVEEDIPCRLIRKQR